MTNDNYATLLRHAIQANLERLQQERDWNHDALERQIAIGDAAKRDVERLTREAEDWFDENKRLFVALTNEGERREAAERDVERLEQALADMATQCLEAVEQIKRLEREKYEAAKRWEAESEDIQSERDALQLACYAAERRVEELREAIKPFAEAAEKYHKCKDDRPLPFTWEGDKETLTVGDLRRARAADKGEGND